MFRPLLLVSLLILPLVAHSQILKVGLSPDYPPLQYKQDGRIVGVEPDNARAVAKILGRELALFEYPFDELIPALEQGRIDVIMSGFSVTAERSQRVTFAEPYLQVGQMAILHKNRIGSFAQPWAIYREGVRVGVDHCGSADVTLSALRGLPLDYAKLYGAFVRGIHPDLDEGHPAAG